MDISGYEAVAPEIGWPAIDAGYEIVECLHAVIIRVGQLGDRFIEQGQQEPERDQDKYT